MIIPGISLADSFQEKLTLSAPETENFNKKVDTLCQQIIDVFKMRYEKNFERLKFKFLKHAHDIFSLGIVCCQLNRSQSLSIQWKFSLGRKRVCSNGLAFSRAKY